MKNAIIIGVIVIAAAGAAAYFLGWLDFSTAANDQRLDLTVSVYRQEVETDVKRAREKVEALGKEVQKRVEDAKADPPAPADEPEKARFLRRAEPALAALQWRIDQLEADLEQLSGKELLEQKQRVADLKDRWQALRDQLDRLQSAPADEWSRRTADFHRALKQLQKEVGDTGPPEASEEPDAAPA